MTFDSTAAAGRGRSSAQTCSRPPWLKKAATRCRSRASPVIVAAAFTFHHAVTEQRSFVLHHLCLAALVMTKAPLVLIPVEDLLGLEEAPNLPGTTDQHPNWRRRLPGVVDSLLDTPATKTRIDILNQTRQPPEQQA